MWKHFIIFAIIGGLLGGVITQRDHGVINGAILGALLPLIVMYGTGYFFSIRKKLRDEKDH